MPTTVIASGAFDDLRSRDLRFLEEAASAGPLTVLLWTDERVTRLCGRPPKFPLGERLYFLRAVRHVHCVETVDDSATGPDALPAVAGLAPQVWFVREGERNDAKAAFAAAHGIELRTVTEAVLTQLPPAPAPDPSLATRRKVIVTGCYDWFHSGHVRFFEEVSAHGDLYVIVGHDANIRLLKGEGHPLLPENERRYVAGSIRFVTQALVSSGEGWLDAEPEIDALRPDVYAVNEDGDKGGKREYCEAKGIEYLVLTRLPAPGLPRRSSTDLRGF